MVRNFIIDFTVDAHTVHNRIRGLSPIPLAFTHTPDGKLLKVPAAIRGQSPEAGALAAPGTVLSLDKGIEVACGTGSGSTAVTLWMKGLLPGGELAAENRGGMLKLKVEGVAGQVTGLYLEGPAEVEKIYEA